MEVPPEIRQAVDDRPLMYLATVDGAGWPNVVPMLLYWWCGDDRIVIGDMFMKTTARNVRETGRAALSMTDPATDVAYKLKGEAAYLESGPELAFATLKLREKSPGKSLRGCVVVRLTAIYHASRGKRAGELIAGEPV